MNILYHHRTQGKTVEGVHIREVIKALRALGHTVYVVSPPGVDPFANASNRNREGSKSLLGGLMAWLSRYMPQFVFEIMEMAYNLAAYRNINKVMKQHDIDLVYERYAFFNLAGVLSANKNGIPIVLEVNEVSGIARQRGQFFIKLAAMAQRYIFEHANVILTVSTFLKEQIAGLNIDRSKVRVVPNSVNTDEFDARISSVPACEELGLRGKTVIGFMGSFSVWDNLEFLIESFSGLSRSDPGLRLVLVGDGFNKGQLEEDVRKKQMNNKIIFTGRVPHEKVPGYIAAMDMAVIPHSNPFGSPVVLFEYMAMSKPVVAPRFGPISEVIDDGENGLLFEPGVSPEMERHIQALADSPAARRYIGERARETINARHLWRHNAETIVGLLGEKTMKHKVPVLTYHDVPSAEGENILTPINRLYSINIASLKDQASFISGNGYKALSLEEFLSWKQNGPAPEKKSVLLTFDDGHASNFSNSFPALARHGLRAVYFITAGYVERSGYVSWAQLAEMAASGNAIGSHGLTHTSLKDMPRGRIEMELTTSKKMLEDKLGVAVNAFSVPRGFYNETVLDVARESGYTAVFTSDVGYNDEETSLYALRRIVMRNNYTLKDLRAIIEGDLRFIVTRRLESAAKTVLQHALGVKAYDQVKTQYLVRKGL